MIAFGRYVVSAGAASAVDFALVQALLLFPALHSGVLFGLAIVIGAVAGMGVNFVLSRKFVFGRDGNLHRDEMVRFFLISLSTLVLRIVVAYAAMAILAIPLFSWVGALPLDAPATRLSHIAAMSLVTIYSYFAHKHISFRAGASLPNPEPAV
jgi:putative flippase GtrA